MESKNRKVILDYLKGNKLMALSTVSGNRPWSATVFFAYDQKLQLLFYSRPDTKHVRHLLKNPFVSVAINQDHGSSGSIRGLQMTGRARAVVKKDLKKLYAIYKKRFPWADEFPDHNLYLITPIETHYIDQKRFGHFFRVRMK